MAPYIYDIYKECDTLYELRAYMRVPVSVCVCMRVRVRVRVRRNVVERKGNAGENAKKGENVVRKEAEERGRECASATFILCCARKNVNYSKVRPAITYHLLLFQTIITICSKCIIKKKQKQLQIS